ARAPGADGRRRRRLPRDQRRRAPGDGAQHARRSLHPRRLRRCLHRGGGRAPLRVRGGAGRLRAVGAGGPVPVPRPRQRLDRPVRPRLTDLPGAPLTRTAAEGQQAWNRYWTRWAAEYDEYQLARLSLPGERETWSQAFGAALPPGTREVLDLGTGSGNVALLLAADGYDVTGIDLSPGMLAQAR